MSDELPDRTLRERRVVAVHLPHLISESVLGSQARLRLDGSHKKTFSGFVLGKSLREGVKPTSVLDAVCLGAARVGVRPGQQVAEARALIADLRVEIVEEAEVEARLVAVAEVVRRFGTTISWQFPDTVWIDATGVAHLFGGEESLIHEIHEQVRLLGHVARVCLASGPMIARAVALFGGTPRRVVSHADTAQVMSELSVLALPVEQEVVRWLSRLGILTIGDLLKLPEKTLASRLGSKALWAIEIAQGVDRQPLVPGEFPRVLLEEVEWEEPAPGREPLLFALRGLVAKISARLRGRGEACSLVELELSHDAAIARHSGVLSRTVLRFELSSPLASESDLERVLKSRISQLVLKAPTVGLCFRASQLSPLEMNQMGLAAHSLGASSGVTSMNAGDKAHQEFPVLLAELQADVGADGLGVLALCSALRPEARSVFQPFASRHKARSASSRSKGRRTLTKPLMLPLMRGVSAAELLNAPAFEFMTRILSVPRLIPVPLLVGATFGLESELYTIERLRFIERLEGVEWWTANATSRDYFWAWLKSPRGGTEALLFKDRHSGERYLQAMGD